MLIIHHWLSLFEAAKLCFPAAASGFQTLLALNLIFLLRQEII